MINEISPKNIENIVNKNHFNPDKRMEKNNYEIDNTSSYNPDKRLEKNEYYATYDERIAQTPKEGWLGERGESLCKSLKEEVNKVLAKYGLDGIQYKNGLADFGFEKCAVEKVEIEMTDKIQINMKKARTAIAKKWNEQKKDGKMDWNPRKVKEYQDEKGLVIHECANRKDCYLMPRIIHEEFTHLGGRAECKKMNEKEVKFDE